jgi:rare lipoprotein A
MRSKIIYLALFLFPIFLMGQTGYVQEGKASFYADKFEGRTTASGERYSHSRSTCAHLTLPFGTLVRVTNLANNESLVVRVNDRGPFVPNRIIDLSRSAAEKLGFIQYGIADVKIEAIEGEGDSTGPPVATSYTNSKPKDVSRPKPQPQPKKVEETPQKQVQEVKRPSPTEIISSSEVELYSIDVTRQRPGGFTIQIGSYKELANLLRIADDLKTSLKKEVKVQVATINGEKVYRLMLGEFSSRRDAEAYQPKAAQLYPDCFIVELK